MKRFFLLFLPLLFPFSSHAQVVITEIMYAPEEGVAHEWFEIWNSGGEAVDLTEWRFNDGSNHVFEKPPKNGGQGSIIISSNSYAIIAKEAATFLSTHSGFSGTVIDGSFSLTDTGDTLFLADAAGVTVNTVSYNENAGAQKNGLSIQLINGVWGPASPTPGNVSQGGSAEAQVASEPSGNNSGSIYIPTPVQTITVDAGSAKRTAAAGADAIFTAKAFGLNGEPILNARFVWSFGDGGMREGAQVSHTYQYPGEYVVILEGASGGYSASDRVDVQVVLPNIFISDVGNADNFFITLLNKTAYEINIEGWVLKSGEGVWRIPRNTIISPDKSIRFSPETTKLTQYGNNGNIALLYPNGKTASIYQEQQNVTVASTISETRSVEVIKQKQTVSPSFSEPEVVEEGKKTSENIYKNTQFAAPAAAESGTPIIKWIVALAGLLGVSFGALFFTRGGVSKNPVDEFKIIEEKSEN